MNTHKYTITNLILNYIIRYELSIEKIKDTPMPSSTLSTIKEKFRTEEIDKLGELISYPIGYNKALTVERGQVLPSFRNKLRIFTNFKNAQDFLDTYSAKSALKPSIELSTHINRIVMKNIVEEWDLGKIKTFSEKPFDLYDTWYTLRDYYPNEDMRVYFNDHFSSITNSSSQTHKLIQLAILLYEYIDKAPFFSGNQITAILTIKALAKIYNLNPYNLIPFCKAFYLISEDIHSAFKISKGKKDLTVFIEAILYTLSLATIELAKEISQTYEKKEEINRRIGKDLNPRQIKIIEYLNNNLKLTRQECTKMMGVSFMTSYRDLKELLDKGYIQQKGKGRGTYYIIPDESDKILTEDEDIKIFT
ncbi:MAG: DeoR family transcriptional regulator [Candidatus Dojkabacteria bacterium]